MADNDIGGVWRTIGGRRVFIRDGKSVNEAMKESGKFTNESKIKRDDKERIIRGINNTKTNTADRGKDDSLDRYTDDNGDLKEEREKIHREIIQEYFDGKTPVADNEKVYYMTGGGSGTGKSNFVKNEDLKYFHDNMRNVIKIDADELKAKLFEKGNDAKYSAAYFHEESSALAKRIQSIALENGYKVMLDGTGDGGIEKLARKLDEAKKYGYKIEGVYGTCSFEKALKNNLERYEKQKGSDTARYVAEREVLKLHSDVSKTLLGVADKFDKVDLYDMNDFENIQKIATGGSGNKLEVLKGYDKQFEEFVDKGNKDDEWIIKTAKSFNRYAIKKGAPKRNG